MRKLKTIITTSLAISTSALSLVQPAGSSIVPVRESDSLASPPNLNDVVSKPSATLEPQVVENPDGSVIIASAGVADFSETMLDVVRTRPDLREKLTQSLQATANAVEASPDESVQLPGEAAPKAKDAALQELDNGIQELNSYASRADSAQDTTPLIEDSQQIETVPNSSPIQTAAAASASYPLRGSALNNNRTWEMNLLLTATVCDKSCVETDRVNARVRVDPAATASRVVANLTGKREHIHSMRVSAVLSRGTSDLGIDSAYFGTGLGSKTFYSSSAFGTTYGSTIFHQIAFEGVLTGPNTITIIDTGRTGSARCRTSPDPVCIY